MSSVDTTTPKILAAMAELGAADAKTISEVAGVGYSTAVRKLRGWSLTDEVIRIDRGNDPVHWELRNGDAPASTITPTAPASIAADVEYNDADDDQDESGAAAGEPEVLEVSGSKAACDLQPAAFDAQTGSIGEAPPTGQGQEGPDVPAPAEANGSEAPEAANASITEPPATEPLATETTPQEEVDVTDNGTKGASDTDTAGRRKPGTLLQNALKVLRTNPDEEYKVLEVCRLIERNNAADGLKDKKVSSGAVANALNKACADGSALRSCDKPATYKAI